MLDLLRNKDAEKESHGTESVLEESDSMQFTDQPKKSHVALINLDKTPMVPKVTTSPDVTYVAADIYSEKRNERLQYLKDKKLETLDAELQSSREPDWVDPPPPIEKIPLRNRKVLVSRSMQENKPLYLNKLTEY